MSGLGSRKIISISLCSLLGDSHKLLPLCTLCPDLKRVVSMSQGTRGHWKDSTRPALEAAEPGLASDPGTGYLGVSAMAWLCAL